MNIVVAPGQYVLALSGGVDSVTLLDILSRTKDVQLVLAHFDHGIRDDSGDDLRFVAGLASRYDCPFVSGVAQLGPHTSEATARDHRYAFLRRVAMEHGKIPIITAHHQGDAVETALLNIERGTGRRGITALASTATLVRPLLEVTKQQILDYAVAHQLEWTEDSTNVSTVYRRNYFRHQLIPKMARADYDRLTSILRAMRQSNLEIDTILRDVIASFESTNMLPRQFLRELDTSLTKEIIATWLRQHDLAGFDTKTLERVVAAIKSGHTGNKVMIKKKAYLVVTKASLALVDAER
jgi:tRNA(Ile)-lysidine synthase